DLQARHRPEVASLGLVPRVEGGLQGSRGRPRGTTSSPWRGYGSIFVQSSNVTLPRPGGGTTRRLVGACRLPYRREASSLDCASACTLHRDGRLICRQDKIAF